MNEYPEYVSPSAHQALKDFSDTTLSLDPEALRERGERIAKTLHVFVRDRLPEPAYDAAALLPLARFIQGDEDIGLKGDASWALADYLTDPANKDQVTPEVLGYLSDIWGDFRTIDAVVFDYQDRTRQLGTQFGNQVLRAIAIEDDTPIPTEYWTKVRAGVNIPKMREVTHDVNVESVVIGAAALLDDIIHEEDPRHQLHNLLVAETFYCPALDALGLSAMESATRNEVNRVRLINAGRTDLLEKANKVLAPIKAIGQEKALETLLGASLTKEKTRFHLDDETPYGATIHFIDTTIQPDRFEEEVRIISRIKGVESLAMKMLEKPAYENVLPSDIIGMTAIVKGEAQLATLFNHIAERVQSLEDCSFVTAGSKTQPMFVQGGEEFIGSLERKIRKINPAILDQIQFKPNDESVSDFQVAKMTFMIKIDGAEVPVEFQFQTEADRDRAETGDSPHFIQKTLGVSEEMPGNLLGKPHDLVDIRNRKRILLALHRNVIAIGNNGPRFSRDLDAAMAQKALLTF